RGLGVPVQRRGRPLRARPARRRERRMNLSTPPAVVTAGASLLADALARQAVAVSAVQWQLPAGDEASVAAVMADPRRVAANQHAPAAMLGPEAPPGRRHTAA